MAKAPQKKTSYSYGGLQYQDVVGVAPEFLKGLRVDPAAVGKAASKLQTSPITFMEFAQAARFFPIVFSNEEIPTPMVIFRLSDGPNPFVKGNKWQLNYRPAAITRYPFVLGKIDEEKNQPLLIDMSATTKTEDGKGELFQANGKISKVGEAALEFCRTYQAHADQTKAICEEMADLGLFEDRRFKFVGGQGKPMQTGKFKSIDLTVAQSLADSVVGDFHRRGVLGMMHAHLISLGHVEQLEERERAVRFKPQILKTDADEPAPKKATVKKTIVKKPKKKMH